MSGTSCAVCHMRCISVAVSDQMLCPVQSATMSAIAGGTLVNVGAQLIINGQSGLGGSLLAGSAVFGALIWRAFWRVKRIDKFEKNI